MARKPKLKEGDVVSFALTDTERCYARVLSTTLFAFYDLKTHDEVPLNEITRSDILFKIMVMNYAFTSGRWSVIGNVPLEDELKEPVWFWNQDPINKKLFVRLGTEKKPATPDIIVGMEREAVWDPEHVEDRLRDHYVGVPNKWLESLAYKSKNET